MMIIFSGGMLVRGILEEKSNRIIEVILSSATAKELLTGKILGLGFLGIFQLIVWVILGKLIAGNVIAELNLDSALILKLIYFTLGYYLYAAIFVGIGSAVSSEQEAQQLTTYISITLILPIVTSLQIIQQPASLLAQILSYFPLTASPVMLLRINIYSPPVWEIVSTLLILVLSTLFVILISSKIFKFGILSYGKRPSLKELINWMKSN